MAKPREITFKDGRSIPILYEDRAVLAIDKPPGWMLAPDDWDQTGRNLQLALASSIRAGEFWARSRNLKYLRFVHRLDAGTSGVLMLVKSPGAVGPYSRLFESRAVEKNYLAVVEGVPSRQTWMCGLPIAPDPAVPAKMRVLAEPAAGKIRSTGGTAKTAETHFKMLEERNGRALVRVQPLTGRTHQIRVHLAATGYPVVGDLLYGIEKKEGEGLALRAISLRYRDPFQKREILITAPAEEFLAKYQFGNGLHGYKVT